MILSLSSPILYVSHFHPYEAPHCKRVVHKLNCVKTQCNAVILFSILRSCTSLEISSAWSPSPSHFVTRITHIFFGKLFPIFRSLVSTTCERHSENGRKETHAISTWHLAFCCKGIWRWDERCAGSRGRREVDHGQTGTWIGIWILSTSWESGV